MTLRMADGPVANLPTGFDAYAGYVNASGIGATYGAVVARFPEAQHFSITTNASPAMCADVEAGAMKSWRGYDYGYCSVANVNDLIRSFGRPRKLWTAHYSIRLGAHICSPACTPGLVTTADGTQWTDHGGWDESLLSDSFFSPPTPRKGDTMSIAIAPDGTRVVERVNPADHLLVFTLAPGQSVWSVTDVTANIAAANPSAPPFLVVP